MDRKNMQCLESAHEKAVAALNDAILITQSTGLGKVPPSLQRDLSELTAVRDRVDARLLKLAGYAPQV